MTACCSTSGTTDSPNRRERRERREERIENLLRQTVYEPPDAIREHLDIEVDQQAHFASRESQIGEKLRLVDGLQFLYRLDLQDHLALDQQVDTIAAFNAYAPIYDWKLLLSLDGQA